LSSSPEITTGLPALRLATAPHSGTLPGMNPRFLRSLIAGVCALAFAFTTVLAQEGEEKKPRGPSKADLKKYDTNQDGVLDEAESAAMKADKDAKKAADKQARLDKYDTNKDGKISKEEKAVEDADKAAAKEMKKARDEEKKADRAKEKSKKGKDKDRY
jgi:hypothetical protein